MQSEMCLRWGVVCICCHCPSNPAGAPPFFPATSMTSSNAACGNKVGLWRWSAEAALVISAAW